MVVEIKRLDSEGKYWHSAGILQSFPKDGIDDSGALNKKGLKYCNSHNIYSGWEPNIDKSLADLRVVPLKFND